ncbi:hypothetical protein ACXHQ9_09180 [Vibrio cincinnatiensis]
MSVETIKAYIKEANTLEGELSTVLGLFNGVSLKQVLKKLTKSMMMGGEFSPESMGLPADIVQKLERYQALNKTIRDSLAKALGGINETQQ